MPGSRLEYLRQGKSRRWVTNEPQSLGRSWLVRKEHCLLPNKMFISFYVKVYKHVLWKAIKSLNHSESISFSTSLFDKLEKKALLSQVLNQINVRFYWGSSPGHPQPQTSSLMHSWTACRLDSSVSRQARYWLCWGSPRSRYRLGKHPGDCGSLFLPLPFPKATLLSCPWRLHIRTHHPLSHWLERPSEPVGQPQLIVLYKSCCGHRVSSQQ